MEVTLPADLKNQVDQEIAAGHFKSSDELIERAIPMMTNEEKDRHVTAAAVHGGAPLILNFNLRHFRREHLEPWALEAQHPQIS